MAEAGRPTLFDENLTPKLAQALARQGLTNEEIAKEMGIATSTLYLWQSEYPLFSEALSKGKFAIDERVQNAFLRRALGYEMRLKKQVLNNGEVEELETEIHIPGDVGAQTVWLKNRKPLEWKEKQPESVNESGGLRITVEPITDMSNVELHLPTKAPE